MVLNSFAVQLIRRFANYLYILARVSSGKMASPTGKAEVELSGFKGIDDSAMAVVNTRISHYLSRYSQICPDFEKLAVRMKNVHAQEHSEKYEVHVSVFDRGRIFTSTVTDKDLMLALETALSKVESEITKTITL